MNTGPTPQRNVSSVDDMICNTNPFVNTSNSSVYRQSFPVNNPITSVPSSSNIVPPTELWTGVIATNRVQTAYNLEFAGQGNTTAMTQNQDEMLISFEPDETSELPETCVRTKWSDLLAPCPTVSMKTFGRTYHAIIDSGAESSMLPHSVYLEFPASVELFPIQNQLELRGANNQIIPLVGFVCIPITIHDHVVQNACFFVKSPETETSSSPRTTLIGNNVLRKLPDSCPLFALTQVNETCSPRTVQMSSQTGYIPGPGLWEVKVSKPVLLKSGKVHKIPCMLDGSDIKLAQLFIYWEGKPLQITIRGGKQVAIDSDGKSSPQLYVQDGYLEEPEISNLTLLVGNLSRGDVLLEPGTSIAVASNDTPHQEIVTQERNSVLEVSVRQVIGSYPVDTDSEPLDKPDTEEKVDSSPTYTFSDGHQYVLPPGLSLPTSLSREELDVFIHVLEENDEAFSKDDLDVGACDIVKHVIKLTDDKPVSLPYRKIPPHLIQEVRQLLQDMLNKGIIRKSFSPYASPLVLVRKKSGKLRPCVDYKQVNSKTVPDAFPLPRIDDMLHSLKGSSLFSSMDLTHGYFQILMDEMSIPFTAFRVPWGLFEYLRVPQGMRNSPGTFSRAMEAIFSDMNMLEVLLYLDDILIFSDNFDEHINRIKRVLERLIESNLKANAKKCQWLCESVAYLGYTISKEGIATDSDKVKVIVEWPLPEKCGQLGSFLGLAGFYRRFIQNFSTIAKPLQELSNGEPNDTITWNPESEGALKLLKSLISSAPVLAHPDFNKEFVVEIDASFRGLGACLSQKADDGKIHPVAFASRAVKGSETRYQSSFKLELAALRWAVAVKFREYLICSKTTVYTDCNALLHLRTAKLGAVEQRWVSQLAPFELEIVYRPGKANRVADALSRHPAFSTVLPHETVSISHIVGSSDVHELQEAAQIPETRTSPSVPADLVAGHSKLFPSFSKQQLLSSQLGDLALLEIRELVLNPDERKIGPMPMGFTSCTRCVHDYVLVDNLLYRKVDTPLGHRHLLLVPFALRQHVLEAAHDFWAHQGRDRTLSIIETRCFWPGVSQSVKQYIKSCARCLLSKPSLPVMYTPRRHVYASRPLEIVSIDFLKMDRGKGGYEDILVCTDVFTKFAVGMPCRDQTALTTAKALKNRFFDTYGIPVRIHSDQGRNFESKIIAELCSLYNISKSRTTAYNPSGNPVTERFNRTLCGLLRSLNNTRDWPDHIQNLVFIYNCTPHSASKVSPYKLFFGRDPTTQLDQLLGTPSTPLESDFVANQQRSLKLVQDVALKQIEKSLDSEKRRFDASKRIAKPLEVGSRALLRRYHFDGRHKLVDRYYPISFVIVDKNEWDDLYFIKPADGSSNTAKWVNRKSLIPDNRRLDGDIASEEDDEFLCPFEDIAMVVEPPPATEIEEMETEAPEDAEGGSELEKLVRRSTRSNRGRHDNPHGELRSAWDEVGKHKVWP